MFRQLCDSTVDQLGGWFGS